MCRGNGTLCETGLFSLRNEVAFRKNTYFPQLTSRMQAIEYSVIIGIKGVSCRRAFAYSTLDCFVKCGA